jgi:hypothetical protein
MNQIANMIGAGIAALIILAGLFSVARNLYLLVAHSRRGQDHRAWFDRPYLFRALAWTATLFWLYGGEFEKQALHFSPDQVRVAAFALYMVAAACFLWVLRGSFHNSLTPELLAVRTRQRGVIGWRGIEWITYIIQLIFAAGIGALFAFVQANGQPWWATVLIRLGALALLIASGIANFWRTSYRAGPGKHTLRQRFEHVIGTHAPDVTQPPAPPAPAPSAAPANEAAPEVPAADAGSAP